MCGAPRLWVERSLRPPRCVSTGPVVRLALTWTPMWLSVGNRDETDDDVWNERRSRAARTLSDSLSSSAGRVDEFVDESGNPLLILGD